MLGKGLVLSLDLLCADFGFVCPPLPVHCMVLFCNALDCVALHRGELHCTASLLRQVVLCVLFGWFSGYVTSSHLASWYIACHKQACFVDVSGMN